MIQGEIEMDLARVLTEERSRELDGARDHIQRPARAVSPLRAALGRRLIGLGRRLVPETLEPQPAGHQRDPCP